MKKSGFLAMSLDGYIAGKNHDLKWLETVNDAGEDYGYAKFFATVDCLFMGRKTFDIVSGFETWPYQDRKMFIRTHRELPGAHQHHSKLNGDFKKSIREIEAQGFKHVYLDGGELVTEAVRTGCIDELTISLIPMILGDGIKLFGPLPESVQVSLKESKAYKSGLVQNVYSFSK